MALFHRPDCESDRHTGTNDCLEVVTSVRMAEVRSSGHFARMVLGTAPGKAADIAGHHSGRSAHTADPDVRFAQHMDPDEKLELAGHIRHSLHDLELHGLP